jgi:hypothetical protein
MGGHGFSRTQERPDGEIVAEFRQAHLDNVGAQRFQGA